MRTMLCLLYCLGFACAPKVIVPTSASPAPTPVAAKVATPIADAYRQDAQRIIEAALVQDDGWNKLEHLTDDIGHRLSGSKSMERAVSWAKQALETDGHENVRLQQVQVPHWVRGNESARALAPQQRELFILGLGGTPATKRGGLVGDVIVISDFEELEARKGEVKGKIVLLNKAMPDYDAEKGSGYGDTAPYRTRGPSEVAKLGGIAALVRSVTAHSLRTPHTGSTRFADDVDPIPAAAVTVEDAEWISRVTRAGKTVRVQLVLSGKWQPDATSHNVIAELRGREHPDEVVVIGAHLDSWDVGQGAHDDGAGCVTMMQALSVLRGLGLRPRRTIRVVLFTNEENGLRGAFEYAEGHSATIPDHVVAIESDNGGFRPLGFRVKADDPSGLAQVTDIVSLLEPIGATRAKVGFGGADLIPLATAGVPTMGLWVEGSKYFDYHHTHADTLDKVDPEDLQRQIAAMAVMSYVLADMPARFATSDSAGTD